MSKKAAIPDAWDDEWVRSADNKTPDLPRVNAPAKLSKAERRAQHVEQQKQLWDTAENPGRNLWLEAQGVVPLTQEIKTPVTLLSRRPQVTIARRDAAGGLANLSINDDEDSEEEARKKREVEFEERQRRAKIEREEKQRKYAEARERIMGASNSASPAANSRENSQGRDVRKTRGRGNNSNRGSQSASPANQSPTRAVTADSGLFDPNDMGRRLLTRSLPSPGPQEGQPMRQPRGPDNSGRGGFGFSSRGGRVSS